MNVDINITRSGPERIVKVGLVQITAKQWDITLFDISVYVPAEAVDVVSLSQ